MKCMESYGYGKYKVLCLTTNIYKENDLIDSFVLLEIPVIGKLFKGVLVTTTQKCCVQRHFLQ